MKSGDLVRFRGNTVHGRRTYLVVEVVECDPGRGPFARMMGQGPTPECVMLKLQFPTWRLEVVDENRTVS